MECPGERQPQSSGNHRCQVSLPNQSKKKKKEREISVIVMEAAVDKQFEMNKLHCGPEKQIYKKAL